MTHAKPSTKPPRPGMTPLRGASGKLYGYIDAQRKVIEFKNGKRVETIHLDDYIRS